MQKHTATKELEHALKEQQRVSQMVIQKDLELSELNDKLKIQVNQLRALQQITDDVRLVSNKEDALKQIAEGLVTELDFSTVVVLAGAPPYKVAAKYSYKEFDVYTLQRYKKITALYDSGKGFIIKDFRKAPAADKKLAESLKITSLAALPLSVRDKKYGVLVCGLDDPYRVFTEADLEFLEIVANSIAISLSTFETEERKKELDVLRTEFVSIASHQLRTPLSIVKWILKMFVDGDVGKFTEDQTKFLSRAYESNERMIDLVNDLLRVSRLEEGHMQFRFRKFNLTGFLKELIDQNKILITKKELTLKTNVREKKTPIYINGDSKKLSLAFTNVLDNAIKFTPKGGTITLTVGEAGDEVTVTVSDTGIGISKEDQGKLFTKFFRADAARRLETDGTGLGLFIVKSIIEKHNGKVQVESELKKGTSFTCRLPK